MESEIRERIPVEWDNDVNNDTILPCPFCGGEAEEDGTCIDNLEYCLQCKECDACIYRDHQDGSDYKGQVIRAWNRRT
jgi:Lar family restriction alleviation protein